MLRRAALLTMLVASTLWLTPAATAHARLAPAGWAHDGTPSTAAAQELRADAEDTSSCASNAVLLFRVRSAAAAYGNGRTPGTDKLGRWASAAGRALAARGWSVRDMQGSLHEQTARRQLTHTAGRCRERRILVAGQFEGADILRRVLAGLDSRTRRQIAHVDLFGMPRDSWNSVGLRAAHSLRGWVGAIVDQMLAGVPQSGAWLGAPTAPFSIILFGDLQCPFCRQFSIAALPTVIERYVRSGQVRLEYEPVAFIGQDSVRAAQMAIAARTQDKLWSFTSQFLARQGPENSGYVTDDFLRAIAKRAGLDVETAMQARGARAVQTALNDAADLWTEHGFEGLPALLIGRTGGPLQPLKLSALDSRTVTGAVSRALSTLSQS